VAFFDDPQGHEGQLPALQFPPQVDANTKLIIEQIKTI
jgi:hypothetical protein